MTVPPVDPLGPGNAAALLEPMPQPIVLALHQVVTVEQDWPERVLFHADFLANPSASLGVNSTHGAVYDPTQGTVTFTVYNGRAVYMLLDGSIGQAEGPRVASLVEGTRDPDKRPV